MLLVAAGYALMVSLGMRLGARSREVRDSGEADIRSAFALTDHLKGLSDQVVVLSFLPAACGSPCTEQQALLKKVWEGVVASAMRDMVTFLTVSDANVSAGADRNGVVARPQGRIEELSNASARDRCKNPERRWYTRSHDEGSMPGSLRPFPCDRST